MYINLFFFFLKVKCSKMIFFFFSSRRRHTRSKRDWSSDVCSSDLAARFLKGSGLPVRIPVIEMVEIGAGGGSIARVDALKRVTVGPESASSEPGPACYGRGGQRPAVTDADVALGKIDPDAFAGGTIKLSP